MHLTGQPQSQIGAAALSNARRDHVSTLAADRRSQSARAALGKGQNREGSAGQIFSALSMVWPKCRLVDDANANATPVPPAKAYGCQSNSDFRGTLLEARHHLLIDRHYAGTHRPFADIHRHGSASWRIVVPKIFRPSTFTLPKGDMPAKRPLPILTPSTLL